MSRLSRSSCPALRVQPRRQRQEQRRGPVHFSSEQRNLAVDALGEAEERTAAFYCIPPYRWQQLNYDLLTRQDQEWEPLPDVVLAGVRRLQGISARRRKTFDFYRIQLNDPSILLAAERENLADGMYDFLLYILTHELVHLVRLSTIHRNADDLQALREPEEHQVQKISRQIFSDGRFSRFLPVLNRFSIW
jgi:hypothetical protein